MTQEFKTSKGEFLGVLVPEDARELCLKQDKNVIEYYSDIYLDGESKVWISIPPGQYKIIGIQTEITEEQAKEIMPYQITGGAYNYSRRPYTEAFNSLMQKLGMYSENPYVMPYTTAIQDANYDIDEVEKWKEAQSKVGTWLIIQKIK